MRYVIIFLAILALGACGKERTERAQEDIKKGNPEGQQTRKKVEESLKQGEAARREGDAQR